jgi:RecA/RadA recombinase
MTQAQIEARRRELERKQEESRRRKVKQQTTALAQAIERTQRTLAESGTAAWVQEEITEIMAVVNKAKDTPASGDIDAVFNELNVQQAKLSSLSETSSQRQGASQREQWMA